MSLYIPKAKVKSGMDRFLDSRASLDLSIMATSSLSMNFPEDSELEMRIFTRLTFLPWKIDWRSAGDKAASGGVKDAPNLGAGVAVANENVGLTDWLAGAPGAKSGNPGREEPIGVTEVAPRGEAAKVRWGCSVGRGDAGGRAFSTAKMRAFKLESDDCMPLRAWMMSSSGGAREPGGTSALEVDGTGEWIAAGWILPGTANASGLLTPRLLVR